jgi:hypothetical protein
MTLQITKINENQLLKNYHSIEETYLKNYNGREETYLPN